jgi:AIG2 family protein
LAGPSWFPDDEDSKDVGEWEVASGEKEAGGRGGKSKSKPKPTLDEPPGPLFSPKADHDNDVWYFAYGSNLFIDQKECRTGTIRRAIPCRLPGYRFAFNKRGADGTAKANIIRDQSGEVWGVAYLCDPEAMRKMDANEGVDGGHYEHLTVEVTTREGETLRAVTYVAGSDYVVDGLSPSQGYRRKIVDGARHHGLPEDYVRCIGGLG